MKKLRFETLEARLNMACVTDPGYAFEDVDGGGCYDAGEKLLDSGELDDGKHTSPVHLVVPAGTTIDATNIVLRARSLTLSGVDMEARKVNLQSTRADIDLTGATIDVEKYALIRSNVDLEMSQAAITVDARSGMRITAKDDILANETVLTAPIGQIAIRADHLTADGSHFMGNNLIDINVREGVDARDAFFGSCNQGGLLKVFANDDIDVTGSDLRSYDKITRAGFAAAMWMKSQAGDIIVEDATLGLVGGPWGDVRLDADQIFVEGADLTASHVVYLQGDVVGTPIRLEEGIHIPCN